MLQDHPKVVPKNCEITREPFPKDFLLLGARRSRRGFWTVRAESSFLASEIDFRSDSKFFGTTSEQVGRALRTRRSISLTTWNLTPGQK